LSIILLVIGTFAILLLLRSVWIALRLMQHPQLEPIEIARPSIAPAIYMMVERIATLAQIKESPPVYIIRSQLPNAFVFAPFKKHKLILTDELLEESDSREDGLIFLEQIICHEMAHISLNHAPRLYTLISAKQLFPIPAFNRFADARLQKIEQQADTLAEALFLRLNDQEENSNVNRDRCQPSIT